MREDDTKIITLRLKQDKAEEFELYRALEIRKAELGISMPLLVKKMLRSVLDNDNSCIDFQNYMDERLILLEKSLQKLIYEQLQSLSAMLIQALFDSKVHSEMSKNDSLIVSEQLQRQSEMEDLPEVSGELPEKFDGVLEMFLK